MAIILPLSGRRGAGLVTYLDPIDAHVTRWSWSLNADGYAQAKVDGKVTVLHRLLLGFPSGLVDHRDRDRLNNRRSNLRVTDHTGNVRNRGKNKNGLTSRFRGVYRAPDGAFVAQGCVDRKPKYLGRYADEAAAAEAAELFRQAHYATASPTVTKGLDRNDHKH